MLENFTPEVLKSHPLLAEAYGEFLYKCPLINCARFSQGFADRDLRNKHVSGHERLHKCSHDGCDYSEVGFATGAQLSQHIQLCHDIGPENYTFPKVQRISCEKALNDAIDRDDVLAVRNICATMSDFPTQETGFLFKAIKRKSLKSALAIMELLGTESELNYRDRKGSTVLHEAVKLDHTELLEKIIETNFALNVKDYHGRSPLSIALRQGCFNAVILLMENCHLKPRYENVQVDEDFRIGIPLAASNGRDDILSCIVPPWGNAAGEIKDWEIPKDERISLCILQAIRGAASYNHESTVLLILRLGRDLDLEGHYHGQLKNALVKGRTAAAESFFKDSRDLSGRVDEKGRPYGDTLVEIIMKGDVTMMSRLLENGADVNYRSLQDQYTPLIAASKINNADMVQRLLENGADINIQENVQAAPLASHHRREGHSQLLPGNNADVNM